ncbi:peptidylprolyl isomerase [Nitrogeniibacter aestuarii]|uniref:peptidylprolyl isomerase n=1 Tax=Nitrogeniibacter aestuarii TaxID=2815343 RepID=UPI001D11F296|nr:peptidylprolyl isomerase [Nitrogeniibacter aestuarii]
MSSLRPLIVAMLSATTLALAGSHALAQAAPQAQPATNDYLARVGTVTITAREYEQAANTAARQKFYHGQPPEAEINALMKDVADQMIDRILLIEAARQLDIPADDAAVARTIAGYEERYKDSPRWQQNRHTMIPAVKARLEEDSRLKALEARIRDIPEADDAAVHAFYESHPDKFTEPEKLRLAMILLAVTPSSPAESWEAADAEAERLHERLFEGEDFAEQARLVSADASASEGGDLGYLHRGMIPEGLQDTIDTMQAGALSAPTRVLQGVAIFKLLERKAAVHHPFDRVAERARDLLMRERRDAAWQDYRLSLRRKADIELNTRRYPALADGSAAVH